MRRTSLVLLSVALAGLGQTATAGPLRQPTAKWVVDYGDTSCTAVRAYGTQEAPVTIAFRPSPTGAVVRLLVVRRGWVPEARQFPVVTSITPATAKMTGLRFATKDKKSNIVWINFDRPALERLGSAGEIAIKGDAIDERFALPGIAAVLKALDRCNEDLRTVWNVDEAATVGLSKPATTLKSLHSYFSENDYPAQAAREEASGSTRFMLMIDETGKLKDCMVERTSGIASLDAMSCGVLHERAKFSPALDASGKPTRSVVSNTIIWALED